MSWPAVGIEAIAFIKGGLARLVGGQQRRIGEHRDRAMQCSPRRGHEHLLRVGIGREIVHEDDDFADAFD
jgi:hypothetical protein